MKNVILYFSLLFNLLNIVCLIYVYTNYAGTNTLRVKHYSVANSLTDSVDFCMVGNSIVHNWIYNDAEFFHSYRIANRGIGGNTSEDVLLRFQADVVSLSPNAVILSVGINDICQTNQYEERFTLDNVKSIYDICKANEIELVITSVLPVGDVHINRLKVLRNLQPAVESLNRSLEQFAKQYDLIFVNYYKAFDNDCSFFISDLTFDGVHPTWQGYQLMKDCLLKQVIESNEYR